MQLILSIFKETKLLLSKRILCNKIMSTRNYKAVIFDMGGVLISGPLTHLNKFENENGLQINSLINNIISLGEDSVWACWERGDFCYDEFKEKFENEYFLLNGKKITLKPTLQEWLPYTLVPTMIDKVKSLKTDGYKTALLTNNMFITPGKSFLPIDSSIFDVVIESCKLGIRKPSEKIFEICLEKLGVSSHEAVFLDDIGTNLKAARKLGCTTIKVTDPIEAAAELDIVLNDYVPSDTVPYNFNHFDVDTILSYMRSKSLLPLDYQEKKTVVKMFSHGNSNPTFYINVNGKEFVLRKKPPGKLLPSAHAVEREYSIMNALRKYGIPVPKMIHFCEDKNIIGTEFYLMEFINGKIYKDVMLPSLKAGDRSNIYDQIVDVLCKIHNVDCRDCGLENKGPLSTRREYLERHINRWWRQYELSKSSNNISMGMLREWLLKNLPDDSRSSLPCTLIHGDFRLDNMIFSNVDGRDTLTAVLDWELSSLGDPVLDLSTVCFPYYMPKDFPLIPDFPFIPGIDLQNNLPKGIPTMEDFIKKYCTNNGIEEIKNFKFYQCFTLFKFAAILYGVAKRVHSGQHSGGSEIAFVNMADSLSKHGIQITENKNIDEQKSSEYKKGSLGAMPLSVDDLREEVRTIYHQVKQIIDEKIIPAEKDIMKFYQNSENIFKKHPIIEELKEIAKEKKLWNLFLPIETDKAVKYGKGLTNLEYSFICEEMGRSLIAPEIFNCSAPDTGNMEILAKYGTEQQRQEWLLPLLEGKIRSCFAMTEPDVASSDARNIKAEINDGGNDEYIINGHKWWTSGALHPNCSLCIFMGKTDKTASDFKQQSMVLIPMNSPGIKILRPLQVFGYLDPPGCHGDVTFTNVKVPKSNILFGEGKGFEIAQGRLGPGRIHHCMRLIGYAERSMELVMNRIQSRETFGKKLSDHGMMHLSIAKSRIEIEQARLLVMKAAHMMDKYGNKKSKQEIAMIKIAVPKMAVKVIDRAIQCFGGAGFCEDYPLAMMYSVARILRVADGPDEVHIQSVAHQMIKDHNMAKLAKAQL